MIRIAAEYPHHPSSLAPARLTAREIWRVAEGARKAVCRHPMRTKVDCAEIVSGSRLLRVNGLEFCTHWDCTGPVVDDEGEEVFGVTHYDPETRGAFIGINTALIADRDDLWRSTAAHELGHAIFDAPSWICGDISAGRLQRAMLQTAEGMPSAELGPAVDWCEWRASEFMGAFLAPYGLLRRQLLKAAVALRLPLQSDGFDQPMLNPRDIGSHGIEQAAAECAEAFGLSPSFIDVRMRKYRLVAGR